MSDITKEVTESLSPALRRLVALLDRNVTSNTYGCFDRAHWQSSGTIGAQPISQQALWPLAMAFAGTPPGNALTGHPLCLDWIRAGFMFWVRQQKPDGSFSHDIMTTAQGGLAMAAAWGHCSARLAVREREDILKALAGAADWLHAQDASSIGSSLILASSAASLVSIARATGDETFKNHAILFLDHALRRQSPEGWYEEPDGPAPQRLAETISLLARVWQTGRDIRLHDSLRRACDFFEESAEPEQHAPCSSAGFFLLAQTVPSAARLAKNQDFPADAVTDADFISLLVDTCMADSAALPSALSPQPERADEKLWRDAGLLIWRTSHYHVFLDFSRGGVLRLWRNGRLVFADNGYVVSGTDGRHAFSAAYKRHAAWQRQDDAFVIETSFTLQQQASGKAGWIWLKQGLALALGRFWPRVMNLINNMIRLYDSRMTPGINLGRRIRFHPDGIEIEDTLTPVGPTKTRSLQRILVPCDRFITSSAAENLTAEIGNLNHGQTVTIKRSWKNQ